MIEKRLSVVLLVVDSLRARSLPIGNDNGPHVRFFRSLENETVCFRRAYAPECWTLPAHCSMFTGLLPSEHGAHFQTMAYTGTAPTVAELLSRRGYHTEIVTRNFIFDGTIPGITRGFQRNTRVLSDVGSFNPFALFLAIAKPRFRRHIRRTGFFHPSHRDSREFLKVFARAMMPADRRALTYILDRALSFRRKGRPYFLFGNLYDVHAPYPPTPRSILRPFWSLRGCMENLMFPYAMSRLGAHAYLRPGFRLSDRGRDMLLNRYHSAIQLMDEKLGEFYAAARRAGLLDDSLFILTSDHGEAFGEHGLYLHDASVFDTHLHVPLWVHHPGLRPAGVDEIVSTRDLFGLLLTAAYGDVSDTILSPMYRAQHPVALAEHFHYPHAGNVLAHYKQNIAAAIAGDHKVIVRPHATEHYDLSADADETRPRMAPLAEFDTACRHNGVPSWAIRPALRHLRQWGACQQ